MEKNKGIMMNKYGLKIGDEKVYSLLESLVEDMNNNNDSIPEDFKNLLIALKANNLEYIESDDWPDVMLVKYPYSVIYSAEKYDKKEPWFLIGHSGDDWPPN
jgi:hypothetical protein